MLVTGGSAANLTALLVARDAAGGPSGDEVVYVSDQAHSSLARTARAMGLRPHQVRVLPSDGGWRLRPGAVTAAVRADRDAGRAPFALCASGGSTNTGAVNPLADLADVCAAEGLWLHVDAAYGGFASLVPKGRSLLAGIERADSVTLDPHKWLFQPMECGSVLIRDGARLERTFAIHPDYLDDNDAHGAGEVNFADRGLQLSRGFRALKVWVSVQTFGLAAFRASVQRGLELAEYAETPGARPAGADPHGPRGPGHRLLPPGMARLRRGRDRAPRAGPGRRPGAERGGAGLEHPAGRPARDPAVRPEPDQRGSRRAPGHRALRRRPPPRLRPGAADVTAGPGHGGAPADQRAGVVAALDGDPLRAVPLLSRVRGATLRALRARAARLTTAAGEEVIRRWDADRSFYIIVAGQFDVLIDGRRIRTLGPGDHFGELAARDWGGGYGYTRLATVVSAGPGELLRLTSDDFRWLVDTEPTARAAIARDLADRLPER